MCDINDTNQGLSLNAALRGCAGDELLLPLGSFSRSVSVLACSLVPAGFDPKKTLL